MSTEYGYARVTTYNSTYLEWKFYNSITNVLIDHFVLTQDDATKPWVIDSFPTQPPAQAVVTTVTEKDRGFTSTDIAIIAFVIFIVFAAAIVYLYYSSISSKPYYMIDDKAGLLDSIHVSGSKDVNQGASSQGNSDDVNKII